MVSDRLLETVVCPETKERLSRAPQDLLAALNARIARGEARDRTGEPVRDALDEALLREDRRVVYPVRDGIPVLLAEAAIPLEEGEGVRGRPQG